MTFERLRRVDGASGLWLAVVLVLFGLLWVGAEKELGVSDPAAYARQAYWIASGTFAENSTYHPFSQRLGMVAPIGLFYGLFGVNLFAAFFWPLCAAIVIICVVWSALSTPTARIVSLVLCLGSWPLFHATLLLFPDLIAAAFMALAALFLSWRARTGSNGVRGSLLPVSMALSLFVALLAKLSAVWLLPFWLGVLIVDLCRADRSLAWRFHLPALATAVVLGASYLLACQILWDNPLARFRGLERIAEQHGWVRAGIPLWRLTVEPFGFFLKEFGIVAVLAGVALVRLWKMSPFWNAYTLAMILCFWLGPTGLSGYHPLPLLERMALPILPGMLVLASLTVAVLYEHLSPARRKPARIFCGLLLLMAILPFPASEVGSFPALKMLRYPRPDVQAMRIVRAEVERDPNRRFLLASADSRSPKALEFYFGYELPPNLSLAVLGDVTRSQLVGIDHVFVYVNRKRSASAAKESGIQSFDRELMALGLQERYREGYVTLLATSSPARLLPMLPKGRRSAVAKPQPRWPSRPE